MATTTSSLTIDDSVAARLERLLRDHPPATTAPVDFHRARFDAGLAWVHYPEGCGGLGAPPELQRLVERRLADAGAPNPFHSNPIGIGMVGPTIVHHGTPAQRARYLRRLWSGEDVWCQLFSEPGAGSDLAGLATQATRDGDGWVVDGQKVWTSLADRARYALLLARTDVDAPKNRGITAFLLDMRTPGVEVRPLCQMTGDAEFSEVFLGGVRLPADARLGPEGRGWQVAMTTLMNERASIGDALAAHGSGPAVAAIDGVRGRADRHPAMRDRVVRMWIEAEVVRMVAQRVAALDQAGELGPVGSVGKLLGAEHGQRIHELLVDLLGAEGLLLPERTADGWPAGPQEAFLRSRAYTIEGGTSEVMRNILAERVLGLPRDDHGPRPALAGHPPQPKQRRIAGIVVPGRRAAGPGGSGYDGRWSSSAQRATVSGATS